MNELKFLAFVFPSYEHRPTEIKTGFPKKVGDFVGSRYRVQSVQAFPGQPDYQVLMLEAFPIGRRRLMQN